MSEAAQQTQRYKVWDLAVRLFHWTLVIAFVTAYVSGDEEDLLHVYAGYVVLGLILFRIIWGFIGSRHARFTDFLYSPRETWSYSKSLLAGKPKHYDGHNPLGGLMVIALLFTLLCTTISGLKVYGLEGHGPLAQNQGSWLVSEAYASSPYEMDDKHHGGEDGEELWEEIHEFFANLMLVLIALHLAGVVVSTVLHKEHLVEAMITGYKNSDNSEQGEK